MTVKMLEDIENCDHRLDYQGVGGRAAIVRRDVIYIVCLRCGYKESVLSNYYSRSSPTGGSRDSPTG